MGLGEIRLGEMGQNRRNSGVRSSGLYPGFDDVIDFRGVFGCLCV